jgi:hypothetical protein
MILEKIVSLIALCSFGKVSLNCEVALNRKFYRRAVRALRGHPIVAFALQQAFDNLGMSKTAFILKEVVMQPTSKRSSWTTTKSDFGGTRIRFARYFIVSCILGISPGCSLCPTAFDYDYGGYSSTTPRSDMRNGRIGSIFSDPALGADTQSAGIIVEHEDGFAMESEYADEIITNDFQESRFEDIQSIEIGSGDAMSDGIEIVSP